MVQLYATRCSCIAILWVSLVSFAAITLCIASQRSFIIISIYFVIDSVRNLLVTPSYFSVLRTEFVFLLLFLPLRGMSLNLNVTSLAELSEYWSMRPATNSLYLCVYMTRGSCCCCCCRRRPGIYNLQEARNRVYKNVFPSHSALMHQ
jgi:hypothetical protein